MSAGQPASVPGVPDLRELGRLPGPEAKREFLRRRQDLISAAVVEQIAELVRKGLRVDVEEALELSEAALAIAEVVDEAASFGRAFRAKANALWFKGDCRPAVELFGSAIAHFEQAGMDEEVGRTLSSSIQPLLLLGEYERASVAAARAREIFQALGDGWRIARLEINLANIMHRQDRFAEALASYERAYQELLPHKDTEGVGVALHNMAVCLIMLNDFERALACYRRVRKVCGESGMPLLALQADYNIAYLHFLRGDYRAALDGLRQTREMCLGNGDAYHAALCDLDEAEIYVELNLSDEAVHKGEQAARQFKALGMGFETGRAVANLAIAHHQQGDSSRAVELFAQARDVFAHEGNQAWLALIDLYQALVFSETGEHGQAQALCVRAREFFSAARLERRLAYCNLLLARLALEAGDAAGTRSRCAAVLETLNSSGAPLLTFQAHLLMGHAEGLSTRWGRAYRCYGKARDELEALRACVQGEELKISFLKNKAEVYERLVEICLRQSSGKAGVRALRYIEQAKSRSLAETLFGRGSNAVWPEAGEGTARLAELRAELNWYYHRIETEQTAHADVPLERIRGLQAEARRREDEFLRILRELGGVQQGLGPLDASAWMEPDEIRAALDLDAVLVEYFQSGPDFLAAVAGRQGTDLVRLAPVAQVSARMRMLEFQWSKFRLRASYAKDFEEALVAATRNRLRELYADVFAPLAPLLRGSHLILAPHGILHYLPFHALLDSSEYLIDRFTISYAPSGSIYAMCRRRTANHAGPALLMGVPDRKAPCITREIRSVAAMVDDPQVYLGETATSERLRTIGGSSRMIHIATHGVFRRDNPMFSSVRLADSYLSLYDLYGLRLPVELLTLSGCGTGLSAIAAGDELLGLMRGLLCAGAQSVLLSLWDLYDETAPEFMASFYTHLRTHGQAAVALRAAMLECRLNHPHPYYWAPFFLVGQAFRNAT
jgi:tetratricopeptide (TPR) repeat protein